ncbi:MAG: TolC family protein [Deltaproteobacteria bacterium]|nr:TolC family protein [Deltaproteobacteria bacterium]
MLQTALVTLISAASSTTALTLEEVLSEVAQRAPMLRAQDESILAARAAVERAGAWDDPVLSFMIEDVALGDSASAMHPMLTYRVAQPLNLFGRRGSAKTLAAARVSTEESLRRRVELDARFEAAMSFYDLWMIQEMDGVLARQIATLERMRSSAKAQYESGLMMGHHDFLRAESELAVMKAERDSLVDQRDAAAVMLDALRGKEPRDDVLRVQIPAPSPLPELAEIEPRAQARPELDVMRSMKTAARAEKAIAQSMYWPMVMAGFLLQQRLGPEPTSIGAEVSVSLPIFFWDRQDYELAMAEAMERRADRELEAMTLMTQAEVRRAVSRARAADRTLRALEDVALPRMRETVDSAEAAYRTSTGTFLALLDSVLSLQSREALRIKALVEREIAILEITRLVGRGRVEPPT